MNYSEIQQDLENNNKESNKEEEENSVDETSTTFFSDKTHISLIAPNNKEEMGKICKIIQK